MVHPLPVVHVLAPVIVLFGATMLLPLGVAHLFADSGRLAYDYSAPITIVAGGLLWLFTRRCRAELQVHHAYLLVALTWTVLPAFAAMPLCSAFRACLLRMLTSRPRRR